MRPIDPTLSLKAAPLAAAPSRGLTSRTPAASQGCLRGGAALTFSDAALMGREAQLMQHRGHTRGTDWQSYPPANRRNALVRAIFGLVELRGLEPLTFSLRRLRLVGGRPELRANSRCIECILILVMIWRGTYGAHVWTGWLDVAGCPHLAGLSSLCETINSEHYVLVTMPIEAVLALVDHLRIFQRRPAFESTLDDKLAALLVRCHVPRAPPSGQQRNWWRRLDSFALTLNDVGKASWWWIRS
jgi:hypothetical protein